MLLVHPTGNEAGDGAGNGNEGVPGALLAGGTVPVNAVGVAGAMVATGRVAGCIVMAQDDTSMDIIRSPILALTTV